MQTVIMFRPLKRTVVFAVGLIFAIAPIAIVSILQPGDGLNWLGILDVVVMSCGSLLLLVGAFILVHSSGRVGKLGDFAYWAYLF